MTRQKKCKACKEMFEPSKPMQSVCDMRCAIKLQEIKREKAGKAVTRKAKEAIKPRSAHMREAQVAYNAWVRERDFGRPCISCGRNDGEVVSQSVGGTWDCGHYRSVGACPELRFEPMNTHRQCKKCNRDGSGMVVEYRIGLIKRIGQDRVDWLEGKHDPKKYTIAELVEIKAKYRAMTRELVKNRTEQLE